MTKPKPISETCFIIMFDDTRPADLYRMMVDMICRDTSHVFLRAAVRWSQRGKRFKRRIQRIAPTGAAISVSFHKQETLKLLAWYIENYVPKCQTELY